MLAARAQLDVRLLGSFAFRGTGPWCSGPAFKRGRELLQYLCSYPRTPVSRETLAEAFWPEDDADGVAHRLHLAVSGARAALRVAVPGVEALRCSGGSYGWDPSIAIESDVDALLAAGKRGSHEEMEAAVERYTGGFLPGEHAEWLYPLRVRCANAYVTLLERLASDALDDGHYQRALEYGFTLVEVERAHEGATRLVMRALAASGRRAAALGEYDALAAYLQKHLGLAPSAPTTALREAIARP